MTRGDVILIANRPYIVTYVNACRARVVPKQLETVQLGTRTFQVRGRPLNISPESDVPIVGRARVPKDLP